MDLAAYGDPDELQLGMVVGLELAMLVFFVGGMIWFYRSTLVPTSISLLVFLSWYLGFSGTLLLPADIADTQLSGKGSEWVLDAWYTVYWTTFVLAWLVLPLVSSIWSGGEFTWKRRIKLAVHENIKQYVAMVIGGIVAIAYLLASGKTTLSNLSGFVMAWGNTYGLMLIVLLLGHGLVEVPRKLWYTSFPDWELSRLHFRATQVDMDLYDSIFELDDAEHDVGRMEQMIERDLATLPAERDRLLACLSKVKDTRDAFEADVERLKRNHGSTNQWDARDGVAAGRTLTPTMASLVALNSRLRRSQEKVASSRQQWEALLARVGLVSLVVSRELPYPQSTTAGPNATICSHALSCMVLLGSRMVWYWRMCLSNMCQRGMAMTCAALSALILWSEIMIGTHTNLSPFAAVLEGLDRLGRGPVALQAAALVPFLYMSVCCYRSLFKLRLFGSMSLQGPHQSLPAALMFNAQYLIRLQFPLGYNFLKVLRYRTARGVSFQVLMNNMEVVPILGTQFNVYAPLVMVVLCLFTFCHGYARLLKFVGLDHEDLANSNSSDWKERLEEGRNLIERSRRQNALRERRRQQGSTGSMGSVNSEASLQMGSSPAGPVSYIAPSMTAMEYGRIQDI